MGRRLGSKADAAGGRGDEPALKALRSDVVDRVREASNVWRLPSGEIHLPKVFGFCRGVEQALACLEQTIAVRVAEAGRLVLLGEIIHNPYVNAHFRAKGVRILTVSERAKLEAFLTAADCAVIPAFGVPLPIERRLEKIGCAVVDTTCGDVRRLWRWAERAAQEGYGVLVLGRPLHDETVVTKSRLAAVGGRYLVVSDLTQAAQFCEMIADPGSAAGLREVFDDDATNAETTEPFGRLAQVSQTTMLYTETMHLRELVHAAYARRHGDAESDDRLLFEPTVCRATQDRQSAAIELCEHGCDLVIVVGGFGSSNTRHLFELARAQGPAFLIEDAEAIHSEQELRAFGPPGDGADTVRDWLPGGRPLRIGVLAGASTPEIVVGEVLQRLADFLI